MIFCENEIEGILVICWLKYVMLKILKCIFKFNKIRGRWVRGIELIF